MVVVVEGELMLPVGGVLGRVRSHDDEVGRGRLGDGGGDEGRGQTVDIFAAEAVLQARAAALPASSGARSARFADPRRAAAARQSRWNAGNHTAFNVSTYRETSHGRKAQLPRDRITHGRSRFSFVPSVIGVTTSI